MRDNTNPFRIEWLPAPGLASSPIPVCCVALIAFLAMEIRMHPRTLDAFVLLCGFVRSFPVALGVPSQPGKGVSESGWRLGRSEGLTEIVQGHLQPTHFLNFLLKLSKLDFKSSYSGYSFFSLCSSFVATAPGRVSARFQISTNSTNVG